MNPHDLLNLLPDSTMGYINLTSLVIAAGSVFAASISKYTANKTDDKIASWLKKAHDLLGFVGLHGQTLDQKRVTQSTVDEALLKGAREHRKGRR